MGSLSAIQYQLGEVPSTSCREYMGGRQAYGYGVAKLDGKFQLVHRWIVEQAEGQPLLPGEEILHHCDNPPCFLYEHLKRGDKSQNREDARRKGRLSPGQSRLTEDQVRAIRAARGSITGIDLAKSYGVTVSTISLVQLRKRWGWVSDVAE